MARTIKVEDEVYSRLLKFMEKNKNKLISGKLPMKFLGIGATAGYLILRGMDSETKAH